ncbi:MAG: TPM domain-containing protein [Bacteroidota bacterium]
MNIARCFKHLLTPPWLAARRFGPALVAEIGAAVEVAEAGQRGEIRFVVEGPLPFADLRHDRTARQRAADLFGRLGIWDTEGNSGVLIYVQLVDRQVEILADRGIAAKVPQAEWEAICRAMEAAFRAGDYRTGALAAIRRAGDLLAEHFPVADGNPNELPDQPLVM